MDVTHLFAGLVVADRDRATAFYALVFGRPADLLPNDREAMWLLTGGANLYLLTDPARAGHGSVAIAVDDLAATVAALAGRGVAVGPIEAVGEAGDKAVVTDPDGNELSLLELKS